MYGTVLRLKSLKRNEFSLVASDSAEVLDYVGYWLSESLFLQPGAAHLFFDEVTNCFRACAYYVSIGGWREFFSMPVPFGIAVRDIIDRHVKWDKGAVGRSGHLHVCSGGRTIRFQCTSLHELDLRIYEHEYPNTLPYSLTPRLSEHAAI